jgi:hypothetical protein
MGRLLPKESLQLYSMAGDRSKLDGVEAVSEAHPGSAGHRPNKLEELTKEDFDSAEAASQAHSDSPN